MTREDLEQQQACLRAASATIKSCRDRIAQLEACICDQQEEYEQKKFLEEDNTKLRVRIEKLEADIVCYRDAVVNLCLALGSAEVRH